MGQLINVTARNVETSPANLKKKLSIDTFDMSTTKKGTENMYMINDLQR